MVSGGTRNQALVGDSTVGGGADNIADGGSATIAGGYDNNLTGNFSSIGGGTGNSISAQYATIPGGVDNTVSGNYGFAAGRHAISQHQGAFVWSDSENATFESVAADEFAIRAAAGLRLVMGNTTCTIKDGDADWNCTVVSDRNAKQSIKPVDPEAILARVVDLPVKEFTYRSRSDSVRHVGPMAQEFHPLFGLGEDRLRISASNLAGVALAAIQGLHQQKLDLQEEVAKQQQRITSLTDEVDRLAKQSHRADKLAEANHRLNERVKALEAIVLGEAEIAVTRK